MMNLVTYCKKLFFVILPILLFQSVPYANAETDQLQNKIPGSKTLESNLPDATDFNKALDKLLKQYYPKIERVPNDSADVVAYEFNTMKFMIHHPLKTGEWQKAVEQTGPQRHGVMCGVRLTKGRFMGAAMVPQVFDNRYFNTLLMAPYSEKHNCHLNSTLSYPERDIDNNFLRDYQRLVNSFADYLK